MKSPSAELRMRIAAAILAISVSIPIGCGIGGGSGQEPPEAQRATTIKHAGYGADQLFEAVADSDADEIARLVQGGADTNSRDAAGRTPLIVAVVTNRHNVVRLLAEMKVNLEERDEGGNTALILASMPGADELQRVLLEAEPLALVDPYKVSEIRPASTVEALLKAGANPDTADYSGVTALMYAQDPRKVELLLQFGAKIDATDAGGRTALMRAALECQNHKVEFLLGRGAIRSAKDRQGNTARSLVDELRTKSKDRIARLDSGSWEELSERIHLEQEVQCLENSQAIMSL